MPIGTFIELVRANQRPGMCVVEVGVWDGDSSVHWAPIVQKNSGSAVLVDNFMGNPGAVGIHAHRGSWCGEVRQALLERMKPFSCVVLLEGDSAEIADTMPDQSVDLCFIDADHRYSRISRDIEAWRTKIKPGGILCGHDCEAGAGFNYCEEHTEKDFVDGKHHGVIKAVKELFPDATIIGDNIWIVKYAQAKSLDCHSNP